MATLVFLLVIVFMLGFCVGGLVIARALDDLYLDQPREVVHGLHAH